MNWESPYQTERFHNTLKSAGFRTEVLPCEKPIYANDWTTTHLMAWEVDEYVFSNMCTGWDANVFEGFCEYKQLVFGDNSLYYTPVLLLHTEYSRYYSSPCKRNIKRGISNNLSIELLRAEDINNVPEYYIRTIIEQSSLTKCSYDGFKKLISKLIICDCADLFVVRHIQEIISIGILLRSQTIANLRFTAINRDYTLLRPMNFMIHQIANYYTTRRIKILDLSGYTTTEVTTKSEKINQFKRGFTHQYAVFRSIKYT